MDKQAVLRRLASGKPLFCSFPFVTEKRIIGTEIEFGSVLHANAGALEEDPRLPEVLLNGGEVYVDNGHLEYAGPEVSNAVSAVAYYEAGKLLCQNEGYCAKLYCHNRDGYGETFGAHENYFTCAPRATWKQLIPFLVTRTILCGSGWINPSGEFEISQRASQITCAFSEGTTYNRGVINLRHEPHAMVPGWERMHVIVGDAGMSEVSTLLRLGIMSLMVEMLECGAVPHIRYTLSQVATDIRGISVRREHWCLTGVESNTQSSLDILYVYLERAKRLFLHRDSVTDAILYVWEDTLTRLSKNPMELWRRLDWVLKHRLLELWKNEQPNWTPPELQSQDMEYHNLHPLDGLYYALHQQMEHVVSDELIRTACFEPPGDTRAFLRGKMVQHLRKEGGRRALCTDGWQELKVVDVARSGRYYYPPDRLSTCYASYPIPDPCETYESLLPKIVEKLS